ncbi:hypothetical protein O3M35_000150 [Rhynocoris fuscipes]|uniref:Chromatin modification-related protein YNG2 n=1 Tax=Rhynocoris fuscipes TaxID=488301 RepID=A0AAW1DP62_9HEMI
MEGDTSDVITNEDKTVNPESPTLLIPMDSTTKHTPTGLCSEKSDSFESVSEPMDSLVTNNKVNGDCNVECSVPSPASPSNIDNNNMSEYKMSTDSSSKEENSSYEDIDDGTSSENKSKEEEEELGETETVNEQLEQTKNLVGLTEEKTVSSEQVNDEKKSPMCQFDNDVPDEKEKINECSSNLESLDSAESDGSKAAVIRVRKASSDNGSNSFKAPQKSSSTSSSKVKSNDSFNEKPTNGSNKVNDRTTRNNKRKSEEKHVSTASDSVETQDVEKFPIQYKGFKKKATTCPHDKHEKRLNLRWNPFNPACKADGKSSKSVPSRVPASDEIDCSALQQSEYAQYLGLQPILKFRCSNCGSSAFQSMVALNTHKIECTKTVKAGKIDINQPCLTNTMNEPKSTNIKLTRKVFLCSACGTYYEHWNLFLHMREVHRRYICLYCLGMFSIAEKLSEHLIQKHKIINQNFNNLEDFQKHCYQAFYLVCLSCDKVFSEMDDFYGHVCNVNKKTIDNSDNTNKSETVASQEFSSIGNVETNSNVTNSKVVLKRPKETSKKSTVVTRSASSQMRKDEAKKAEDISAVVPPQEDVKSADVDESKLTEDTNASCSNEIITSEQNEEVTTNETDIIKQEISPRIEQDIKLQESQASSENVHHTVEKTKPLKKTRSVPKRVSAKRKKPKETEETNEESAAKVKKVAETNQAIKESNDNKTVSDENSSLTTLQTNDDQENCTDIREELNQVQEISALPPVKETKPDTVDEQKDETVDVPELDKPELVQDQQQQSELAKDELPTPAVNTTSNANIAETKSKLQANLLKFKLPGMESDAESDDSQKLSLVVDETAKSDSEDKVSLKSDSNSAADQNAADVDMKSADNNNHRSNETANMPDITLASSDVTVMALTLDDKIENIPIQTVLKECVRTSCMSCNYCRHAVKIAVNGKQLAYHILSEHRYMPIKNETPDDVINKLRTCLDSLENVFFNTETYDSSDPSIHVPYDQDSSFDCFQCNYVTTTHRDLFAHKRKSHTKSLLLCIMCKSNFYSYSELLCHLCPGTYNAEVQFHNVDINFRCCFCRLDTIPSAFRLMVHLRKTHHACDICLESGVDQQKLSTHMWKHKLNHLCYRCGIAYASKPDITKHLFWKHGTESVLCKKCLQKKWPHVYHFCIPPTSFICEECNTSFSKAVALKVHKRIHGNDYPYTCSECSKKFVSKKLLQRHEERHLAIKNNVEQKQLQSEQHDDDDEHNKDEIINVSDVISDNKESSVAELSDSKETETKDKSHKKHKKDKEKKSKQVVDVYDLPPLNLSSESDSSDEENQAAQENASKVNEKKDDLEDIGQKKEEDKDDGKINLLENTDLNDRTDLPSGLETEKKDSENMDTPNAGSTSVKSPAKEENNVPNSEQSLKDEDLAKQLTLENNSLENKLQTDDIKAEVVKERSENETLENTPSNDDTINNKEVEDIWKNFYSTNPQNNSNLPYPLCAINSEIALGIIMGDHDYCHQPIVEPPSFREEIPSTSQGGLAVPLITEQLEEITEPTQPEKANDLVLAKETASASSPINSPKKKPKSPKKKNSKGGENDNNSSSSSDSSSESSSSSCSCGPNCSCSSSSSNSSSSSSSDSDSSAAEDGNKQERKRKKRERRSKTKSDHEPEQPPKEPPKEPEVEKIIIPLEPVDPPIRESELETDETTTDEEFYDQQPQRIANQLLAEKRNQLMLLASAANANNGNASPSPLVDIMPQEVLQSPKQKVRTKRKRKITTKGKANTEKSVPNSHQYSQYPKDNEQLAPKPIPPYLHSPMPPAEQKLSPFVTTPAMAETPGSGSETEKSRSSKRRRIPNKFYGYSSGDDDEKPAPSPKWRKQDTVPQPQRIQPPPVHPPTPRIQLTVPKQVIRKPYKLQKPPPPKVQPSSSDSTDSGSEMEHPRVAHTPAPPLPPPPPPPPPPVAQDPAAAAATAAAATSQKNEKDVYCYCRCPYDEVSEMIACDDENCEIEWFHFECVGILVPPRGQWFCPGCRKARGLPT